MNRHQRRGIAHQRAATIRANVKMRVLLAPTYEKHDKALNKWIDESGTRARMPCTKGCAACCSQLILITLPEAAEIVLRHPEVVADVRAELEAQDQLLEELAITPAIVNIFDPTTADERMRFLDRYFALDRPCAFLRTGDKTCRVYASRPIACRTHGVVDVTPDVCALRGEAAEGVTAEHIHHEPSYAPALTAIAKLSEAMVGGYSVGPLPVMVLVVADRPEFQTRRAR